MKKVRCKLLALLLCAALLGGLTVPASGSSNIYFMAVNDTMLDTTVNNMPLVVGGVLYVPYIMLSARHTGINLGVNAQYSAARRTVLLSKGPTGVIFNPQSNVCTDLDGKALNARAVVRNSMVYLPVDWVCEYFGGISYTTVKTDYGTLVRVTNSVAVLSDVEFVDAADSMLKSNYNRYWESVTSNVGGQGGTDPGVSDQPETGPVVYLAFRVDEKTEETAQLLEFNRQWGLFLFTVEELAAQDGLARRLVGAGHMVGLELTGSDGETCLAEAEEGGRLLMEMTRSPLTILYAPNGDGEAERVLTEAGYALWKATDQVGEDTTANGLLRDLNGEETHFVEINCDEPGLLLLDQIMDNLTGADYRLRQTVAPVL